MLHQPHVSTTKNLRRVHRPILKLRWRRSICVRASADADSGSLGSTLSSRPGKALGCSLSFTAPVRGVESLGSTCHHSGIEIRTSSPLIFVRREVYVHATSCRYVRNKSREAHAWEWWLETNGIDLSIIDAQSFSASSSSAGNLARHSAAFAS